MPPTFDELRGRELAGARAAPPGGRRPRSSTDSSAASGIADFARDPRHPAQAGDRLLGELDVERLDRRSGLAIASRPSQASFASTRIRACGPDRLAHRRDRAASSSPAPSFSLKVAKPSAAQSRRLSGDLVGFSRGQRRVAVRPARARSAEELPQRHARCLGDEVEQRALERRRGGGGEPARRGQLEHRRDREPRADPSSTASRSRPTSRVAASAMRLLDLGERRAAAERQRHRLAEPLRRRRRCAAAAAPSRAGRAPRGRSRRARGTAARRERSRALDPHQPSTRPAASSTLNAASSIPVAGQRAVQAGPVGARADRARAARARAGRAAARAARPPGRRRAQSASGSSANEAADERGVERPGPLRARAAPPASACPRARRCRGRGRC